MYVGADVVYQEHNCPLCVHFATALALRLHQFILYNQVYSAELKISKELEYLSNENIVHSLIQEGIIIHCETLFWEYKQI